MNKLWNFLQVCVKFTLFFPELVSFQPAEELQFVWCELLYEALAAIWNSSVAADPNLWLKWDPQRPKEQPSSKKHTIDNRVSDF